ncbi:hypothetical protein FRC16_007448 [Serendipita sp. 398]|nr:hypothetical protein FRC16_007448 [Serendipita sp. 398]
MFDSAAPSPRPGVALLSPLTPATGPKPRTMSRTSKINGSAYGYSSRKGSRMGSMNNRRPSMVSTLRNRRYTNVSQRPDTPHSFAQRLLLANEMNATSLADLWVQAAINVDNEEVFESDSEISVSDHEEGPSTAPVASTSVPSSRTAMASHRPSMASHRPSVASTSSRPGAGLRRLGLQFTPATAARRPSAGSLVPAIFSHTGVRTPPNIAHQPSPGQSTTDLPSSSVDGGNLSTIAESRPTSTLVTEEEKLPSTWSMLPMLIILQYGLLAFHSTTHDQIFYLYLVSGYSTGGLELTAGHFAQLIAMMCLVQIIFQFYLYPNIGSVVTSCRVVYLVSYISAAPREDGSRIWPCSGLDRCSLSQPISLWSSTGLSRPRARGTTFSS